MYVGDGYDWESDWNEYLFVRAARYLGVPVCSPQELMDSPYWVRLAIDCESAEAQAQEFLRSKQG